MPNIQNGTSGGGAQASVEADGSVSMTSGGANLDSSIADDLSRIIEEQMSDSEVEASEDVAGLEDLLDTEAGDEGNEGELAKKEAEAEDEQKEADPKPKKNESKSDDLDKDVEDLLKALEEGSDPEGEPKDSGQQSGAGMPKSIEDISPRARAFLNQNQQNKYALAEALARTEQALDEKHWELMEYRDQLVNSRPTFDVDRETERLYEKFKRAASSDPEKFEQYDDAALKKYARGQAYLMKEDFDAKQSAQYKELEEQRARDEKTRVERERHIWNVKQGILEMVKKSAGGDFLGFVDQAYRDVLEGVSRGEIDENRIPEVVENVRGSYERDLAKYIMSQTGDSPKSVTPDLDAAIMKFILARPKHLKAIAVAFKRRSGGQLGQPNNVLGESNRGGSAQSRERATAKQMAGFKESHFDAIASGNSEMSLDQRDGAIGEIVELALKESTT